MKQLFCAAIAALALLAPPPVTAAESSAVSNISWDEVDRVYNPQSDATDLQKAEAWKNYEGKKVRWTGKVSHISEGWGGIKLQVRMRPDTLTSDLIITLEDSERARALQLRDNQRVTFEAILEDWGTIMPMSLDHGRIVE